MISLLQRGQWALLEIQSRIHCLWYIWLHSKRTDVRLSRQIAQLSSLLLNSCSQSIQKSFTVNYTYCITAGGGALYIYPSLPSFSLSTLKQRKQPWKQSLIPEQQFPIHYLIFDQQQQTITMIKINPNTPPTIAPINIAILLFFS